MLAAVCALVGALIFNTSVNSSVVTSVVTSAKTVASPSQPIVTAQGCVAQLPLSVRIGQTMLVILNDPNSVRDKVARGRVAGLMPFGTVTKSRAKEFQRVAAAAGSAGVILASDEEGGSVQRYRSVLGSLPSARKQATSMSTAQVRAMYREYGRKLRRLGVTMAAAPVLDVGGGPAIGRRAYSTKPSTVTKYGIAAIQGYRDAGIIPVVKHFPGHGRASADSHIQAATGPSLSSIRKKDLLPFRDVIRAMPQTAVMVGHIRTPGLSTRPASQSKKAMTGLLQGELGARGLIVSDGLGMAGTQAPSEGIALVRFLSAGGDLGIVTPTGLAQGPKAVRAALKDGGLKEARLNDAVLAVFRAKGINPCSVSVRA